jgi:hypothetical protein
MPATRSDEESSHRWRANVTHTIPDGQRRSGSMMMKPRLASGEGAMATHLSIGENGGKGEASTGDSFYRGRREREEAFIVSYIGDGRLTACRSGGDMVHNGTTILGHRPVPLARVFKPGMSLNRYGPHCLLA